MNEPVKKRYGLAIIFFLAVSIIFIYHSYNRNAREKSIKIINEKVVKLNKLNDNLEEALSDNKKNFSELDSILKGNATYNDIVLDLKENYSIVKETNESIYDNIEDILKEFKILQDLNVSIVFVSLLNIVYTTVSTLTKLILL